MADKPEEAPRKKGKGKMIILGLGAIVLIGGGIAGGLYAGGAMAGGHAVEEKGPKLVLKSEQKRGGGGEEGEEGPTSVRGASGEGGDKYASTYYPLEKDFTSNLRDSVHFVQMGLAVSSS